MLRSVTLGVALSVLATACAVVEQPVPVETVTFQAQVRNASRRPLELTVTTPAGVLAGAVQPALLPAGSTTNVTFYVPAGLDYAINAAGSPDLTGADLDTYIRTGCAIWMALDGDQVVQAGCHGIP